MRIGLAVTTREELPGTSRKRRLRGLFRMAGSIGYDGVELHISNPRKADTSLLKRLAATYGVEVPAVGTGPTYTLHGISFLGSPTVRRRAVNRLQEYIRVANDLDAVVIIGLIRGKLADGELTYRRAWSTIRDCLTHGARVAEDHGVVMAIEPINRYETDLINTVADAVRMVSEIGSENVKIMADTFHMNIEESSIAHVLRQGSKKLVHFHVADSNRLAPGKGHINFKSILSNLRGIGYRGYVSAEILPKPTTEQAFRDAMRYLRPLLKARG